MPTTDSPLRYPGGKTQLAPFVSDLLRINDLHRGVYAEPFAGGAGIAWRLLFAGRVTEVWLNDIDIGLHAFWNAVLTQTDDLCERIERTPVTMDQWLAQKRVFANPASKPLAAAFATFFLNRTNRSGIIAGGVIGGKGQDGTYTLDCRFNKDDLIQRIRRIASYRDVVRLSRMDARQCIAEWSKMLPQRSLLNIDPPYFRKGQELYTNFYTPRDHRALATVIKRLKCPWMLTYDDERDIEDLYKGYPTYRKALVYYAQVKRRANELLVLSQGLRPPAELNEQLLRAA